MTAIAKFVHHTKHVRFLPYTPTSALNGGDVLVVGSIPLIPHRYIAANEPADLACEGGVYEVTADGAMSVGDILYWDAANNKVTLTPTGVVFGHVAPGWSATADGDKIHAVHDPRHRGVSEFFRPSGKSVLHALGVDLWFDAGKIYGIAEGGTVSPWIDRSGNAISAVEATNPPQYNAAGLEYPELEFDGTNDILTVAAADFTNSLTALTVLVNLQLPAGADGYFFGRYRTGDGERGWAIKFDDDDSRWEVLVSTDLQEGDSAELFMPSLVENRDIRDDGFHTVGFRYATGSPGTVDLLLDGTLIGKQGSTIEGSDLYDSTADVVIGNTDSGAEFIACDIRHAAVFNKVLTEDQIAAVHAEWSNPGIWLP